MFTVCVEDRYDEVVSLFGLFETREAAEDFMKNDPVCQKIDHDVSEGNRVFYVYVDEIHGLTKIGTNHKNL